MSIGVTTLHKDKHLARSASDRKIGRRIALFLRSVLPRALFCWVSRSIMQCQSILNPRKWAYWTQISDQLYLGAIPLRNWNHIEKISALGVTAILSINEEHEFNDQLFAKPVKSEDWKKRHMQVLKISSPDLEPMPAEKMATAVHYVMQQVKLGNQVYMHCTAGRGRSASVAICTVAKMQGISLEQSMQQIKAKRPQLSLSQKQLEAVQQCYKLL